MQTPPSHNSVQPELSEMDAISHPVQDEPAASVWDWSDFLDFDLDQHLNVSWDSEQPLPSESHPIGPPQPLAPEIPGRIRKRDPRLTCSNFIAGRIPCACPEIDGKLEEEEGVPGKKRVRTARCQVPVCEADIRELKGYHRRHRVCLRCANAGAVVLDEQSKRYCQQCGK